VDAIYAWQNVGFTLLVITAGLASISQELVTPSSSTAPLPPAPALFTAAHAGPLFAIIIFWRFVTLVEDYASSPFDRRRPGTSTTTVTLYLYNQLTAGDNVGLASAAAILIALMTIIVGMVLARVALLNKQLRDRGA